MKSIFIFILTIPVLLISCQKETTPSALLADRLIRPFPPIDTFRPWPVIRPVQFCIYSYKEMLSHLGTDKIAISGVVLDNGITINVGNNIESITYSIQPGETGSSLFKSQLQVNHQYYGYIQSLFSEVWSLGCVYTDAAVPPFTNVILGSKSLLVNTCFFWGIAPNVGVRIKYIIIQ